MSGQERFIFSADKMVQRAVTSVKMWKEELRRTNVDNELKEGSEEGREKSQYSGAIWME